MCDYCKPVVWEKGEYKDRYKLFERPALMKDTYIANNELIKVEIHLGYFLVLERERIFHCPICAVRLERLI